MMVRARKGHEVASNLAVRDECPANTHSGVAALPYFPVVLPVENVCFREWDFKRKTQFAQKRYLEREGEHRPEMRQTKHDCLPRNASELSESAVEILERQMLQYFKRAYNIKRLIREGELENAPDHVGMQVLRDIHRRIRHGGVVFYKTSEYSVSDSDLEHGRRFKCEHFFQLPIITCEPSFKGVCTKIVVRLVDLL